MQSRDKITDEELQKIFMQGQQELRNRQANGRVKDGNSLSIPIPRSWEYGSSEDLDIIIEKAVELGWKDNKVQVKRYELDNKYVFYIEPYEDDCSCPGLLKYEDYVVGG